MRRRLYLLPMKRVLSRMTLLLLLAASDEANGQEMTDDIPFHDLFSIEKVGEGDEAYMLFGPDSLKADPVRGPLCSALRNLHEYLYSHFAAVYDQEGELLKLLPDTAALQRRYDELLDVDTAFQRIYLSSLRREMVEPLSLDSAMHIAAHFYYLHRMGDKATMHVCVGINKVREMSGSPSHMYHAAFCYMAIWGMDDSMKPGLQVIEPFRPELKAGPSDERLQELEQLVYNTLARNPELRTVLLKEYERKAKYLNFELAR